MESRTQPRTLLHTKYQRKLPRHPLSRSQVFLLARLRGFFLCECPRAHEHRLRLLPAALLADGPGERAQELRDARLVRAVRAEEGLAQELRSVREAALLAG